MVTIGSLIANVWCSHFSLVWSCPRRQPNPTIGEGTRLKIRLGVDVACRAAHQASLADEQGRFLFVGHRFRTDPDELDTLWARLPKDAERIEVVMEPTRNAWVALAA